VQGQSGTVQQQRGALPHLINFNGHGPHFPTGFCSCPVLIGTIQDGAWADCFIAGMRVIRQHISRVFHSLTIALEICRNTEGEFFYLG
jgi:hypothetical protein